MNTAQREQLKDNLRAMISGSSEGIDLNTPSQWVVEGIKKPEPFFTGLTALIPADSILYFEGCRIAPEVATFYEAHRAPKQVAVARDTLFPDPDIYHIAFSPAVVTRLRELSASRSPQELGDHIKAYRGDSLLFTFHDAFDGWLVISEHVNEALMINFCRCLGVTYRREQTKKRDPEQLRAFLKALEHPDQIRFTPEAWWRRIWREFLKGWNDDEA
jgi:hypothetical protein